MTDDTEKIIPEDDDSLNENSFYDHDIFTAEKKEIKGEHLGDRSIRIRKTHLKGIKKIEQGAYEITADFKQSSLLVKIFNFINLLLIGKPIRSENEIHERLTKIKGLAVFASDNISSSAYATEEIMRVLMFAGAAGIALTMPISISILILLSIVGISYLQTIKAYPSGGGSYIVAKDNLGDIPGLIAASSLLIDYILTVSVSTSAGILAIVSAFPALYEVRILLCILAIIIITMGNLRGIRESATIFALPVYIYIFSMLGVLGYGIIKYLTGGIIISHAPALINPEGTTAIHLLSFFLILRAFSSGACGLTGVEAVADGVPAFKPPEARNARITLIWTISLFGTIFFLLSFLSIKFGIMPDPHEKDSLVSLIIKTIVGTSWAYYLVQFATMFLLVLAANTSFADFPRLSYFLARDKFLPSHFGFKGDRLAFNNGIIFLAVISAIIVIIFKASVTNLIPLYTIGVFISFTLSQSGMVVRWWKTKSKGWYFPMILNAVGAIITFVVLIVVGVTKFALGAWIIFILIPGAVFILFSVRQHYRKIEIQIAIQPENYKELTEFPAAKITNYIIIPVSNITRPVMRAVAYAHSIAGVKKTKVIIDAIHITDDINAGHDLQKKWSKFNTGIPLILIESPYRRLIRPILHYIDAVDRKYSNEDIIITVLVPEVVSAKWWQHLYRTNTAFLLKGALLFRPRTVVLSFPYHV